MMAMFSHSVADAVVMGFSKSSMLLYGYVTVVLLMTIGRDIAENLLTNSNKESHRLAVEDVYVAMSAVASIMVCQG